MNRKHPIAGDYREGVRGYLGSKNGRDRERILLLKRAVHVPSRAELAKLAHSNLLEPL